MNNPATQVMLSEEFWVKPTAITAFFLMLTGGVVLALWQSKNVKKKEEEARKKLIDKGVSLGQLNEFGEPLCAICGQIATHPLPRTGRMWIDKIIGLRTLNELTAMPWRYNIEDAVEDGLQVCATHRASAIAALRHVHSQMRSEHAKFNASQQHKIRMLEQGGLLRVVGQEAREIQKQLGMGVTVRGLFDSLHDGETIPKTHVLAATSSSEEDTNQ